MSVVDPNDFRSAAAEASVSLLRGSGKSNPLNFEGSLCVPNEGDATGSLYKIAVVPWLFALPGIVLVLGALLLAIMILTPWVDLNLNTVCMVLGSIVVGVTLLVSSNSVSDGVFDRAVRRWNAARVINDLQSRTDGYHEFAIEDTKTFKKHKVISEDYAKGGMDRTGRGLILAGCRCLYVIRPREVESIQKHKRTLVIAVRIEKATLSVAISPLITDEELDKAFYEEIEQAFGPVTVIE